jgi:hypothetical protein
MSSGSCQATKSQICQTPESLTPQRFFDIFETFDRYFSLLKSLGARQEKLKRGRLKVDNNHKL